MLSVTLIKPALDVRKFSSSNECGIGYNACAL